MIHIENNECPICFTQGLLWNINHQKTQIEMFKCGHGICKECYKNMCIANKTDERSFSCPLCREDEQQFSLQLFTTQTGAWATFAEWYSDYEIYIKSGSANNIVKNSAFGQQLLRLIRENPKTKTPKTKNPKTKTPKTKNPKTKTLS